MMADGIEQIVDVDAVVVDSVVFVDVAVVVVVVVVVNVVGVNVVGVSASGGGWGDEEHDCSLLSTWGVVKS